MEVVIRKRVQQVKTISASVNGIAFPWILRTDASSIACAATLFQVISKEVGTPSYQLIGCASKRLSAVASDWDIHKKE